MKHYKKLLVAIALPVVLAGCTVPGAYLNIDDKQTTANSDDGNSSASVDILDRVNLYPLTADKMATYKAPRLSAQINPELDTQLAAYEYHVGAGDILNVTIWDHPELTIPAGSYRSASESGNWVHADGTIFYPYIGFVPVAGKTVVEIRAMLTKKLAKFIETPQVDVNVAAFRSKKTYITGEVDKPGQQFITNVPLTLLDAINHAGGLAEDADWRNVTLTRQGVEQKLSLHALMQRGDLTQNRLLMPGDIVHVPRNDGQKVFVMGEVNEPKLLKIDRAGMSLTEALSNVGGINQLAADATGIFVVRANRTVDTDNAETAPDSETDANIIADIYQLDISNAAALVIGTEFELQPYDIVYVTAAPITRWNRVIGQILPTVTGFNELTEGVNRVRAW
ncbi:polysaccharide export protein [Moritella sp. F3]|uniref:polysaccharide export protein n=1 Tax=Moritella sp. F3 TaxID=2718882 RepID=UPI0018E1B0BF|nr:polysaccharide export protein [Moritella sp. F3]GIC77261.1 polysaccharide export protein Wza [Moritella sp. F1]GIC83211.1 polysaccharide export protein Wza [Moritella sp. F3]